MSKKTYTYDEFAQGIGKQDADVVEATKTWHVQFSKASPELQGEMRNRFYIGYLMGRLKITEQAAQTIIDTSRLKRTKTDHAACDRAKSQFSYYIIHGGKKAKANKGEPPKTVRISAAERAAWEKFVKAVGEERAAIVAKTLG